MKKSFKFHILIQSNLLHISSINDLQLTAAEMPLAQIRASMRE